MDLETVVRFTPLACGFLIVAFSAAFVLPDVLENKDGKLMKIKKTLKLLTLMFVGSLGFLIIFEFPPF